MKKIPKKRKVTELYFNEYADTAEIYNRFIIHTSGSTVGDEAGIAIGIRCLGTDLMGYPQLFEFWDIISYLRCGC